MPDLEPVHLSVEDVRRALLEDAKRYPQHRPWETWEDDILREFHGRLPYHVLAEKLGRTISMVSHRRQCYKAKLAQTRITLPVNTSSTSQHGLDEDFMERVVTNSSYWEYLQSRIHFDTVSLEDFEAKSGKKIKVMPTT